MEQIDAAVAELSDQQLARLERKSELGADFHFGTTVTRLRAIREMLVAYRDEVDPMQLPSNLHPGVVGQASSISPILEEIRMFSPGAIDDSPRVVHEQIDAKIEAIREWFATNVRPQIRAREVAAATASADLSGIIEKAQTGATEIDRLLTAAKQQAGESASGRMSSFHNNRVKKYHDQARNYLIGVAMSGAVLVAMGIAFFGLWPPETAGDASDWQPFIADIIVRLFFLGLASYALAFCARNFRISRHLEVTHEQRQVALDTYPMLVEAVYDIDDATGTSSGADARNIITAELARAAFGPIESGFLQEERERTIVETQSSMVAALTAFRR